MKKAILGALCAAMMTGAAAAGDINPGAVPGTINYQGRLERDNAPVTGPVHILFRVYNAASGGTQRWASGEMVAQAAQGIFSANISPDWSTFSNGEALYLEVQVEGEILTPREPLSSVAYAIVAKKLEDGASVSVATFTAAYQVLLATSAGTYVGIGTLNPDSKLTVNGPVKLLTGGILFPDNTFQYSAGIGTAGGLSVSTDTVIVADSDNNGSGDIMLYTGVNKRLQIYNATGRVGIGPAAVAAPQGLLDVDGSLYVGNAGIYDRDDGEVNIRENLGVDGGRITGANLEYIALGEVDNVIGFVSGGAERMRVNSNGFVGVANAAPAFPLDVTGDIHTNTGLLAAGVSAGSYSGWPSAANEVRAANLTHLLLQQNNPFNVGIGTDTPREKLHVRGSVRSDYGIIASTGYYTGDVRVLGDLIANGSNRQVYLTTTTIYGTLTVTGGIGSTAGFPAYLASTQTLSGQNTFSAQVTASSDVVAQARLGAAMKTFNFPGGRYLQVGDNKPEYSTQDTYAYLVGGDSANSRLSFYRGPAEAGSIGSIGGSNVGLIVAGSTKTIADATYYRVQNSVVWVSTGYNTTPAIFVSSGSGNVGIGTTVPDSTYKLTVNGSLRIAGPTSNAIYFADGTFMNSAASIGQATSISNSGDAIIAANTLGGGGSVILRSGSVDGLTVDSGGNVGIGTLNPVSKLNVRGGDVTIGNPVNPYSGNGVEDLLVAGSVVLDGSLIQRSAGAAQFSGLIVSGDVFLSTGTGKKTGVATNAPVTTLDVAGSAQFGSGTAKSTFTAAGVLQLAAPLGSAYGGMGANLGAATTGAIPYFGSLGVMTSLAAGTAGYLLQANGAGSAPSWVQATNTSAINTIVKRDASGNFAGATITATTFSGNLTGDVTGNASGLAAADLTGQSAITAINTATAGTINWARVSKSGSNLNELGTRNHSDLSGIGTNTHAQIDTHIGLTSTAHGATSNNTGSTLVARDVSGNFSANIISASLNGNASSANSATTAGALSSDPGNCTAGNAPLGIAADGSAQSCFDVATQSELDTHTGATSAHSATSANTINRIVMRDGSGNFSAGTISADLNGNAATATKPAVAGTAGKAACWKVDGSIGYCSSQPNASGDCTCN